MKLRRGFKKEANGYAKEFRKELQLKAFDPLCPWALAELLTIPVIKLTSYSPDHKEAVQVLTGPAQKEFSAISVFSGKSRKRIIVHNNSHHPHRQAANIAHELSHAILLHPPTPPFTETGDRNYNPEIKILEDEANWLGPALMISEEAALHISRQKIPLDEASEIYGVSEQLIKMRINVTGARRRANYRRR